MKNEPNNIHIPQHKTNIHSTLNQVKAKAKKTNKE